MSTAHAAPPTRRRALEALAGWGALAALPLGPGLAGCAAAELEPRLPAALAGAPGWAVTGRQGWLPQRQPLRFGPYATGPRTLGGESRTQRCPRGCSAFQSGAWDVALRSRIRTTRHELQFRQHGPGGGALDVQALATSTLEEREWTLRALGLTLSQSEGWHSQGPWTGLLEPASPAAPAATAAPEREAWRFAIDEGVSGSTPCGQAQSESGRLLTVWPMAATVRPGPRAEPVPAAPGPAAAPRLPAGWWMGESEPGDRGTAAHPGAAVAAVLAFGAGRVWLREGLDAERALVAAALASVLLVRPSNPARNLL